ncbi:MAG: hypothetical protein IJ899_18280 [Blautia sp.]|nr:hypothetical protein [Blautia sp.]
MSRKKKLIASVFLISVFCMLFSTTAFAGGLVDTMKKHLSGMLEDILTGTLDKNVLQPLYDIPSDLSSSTGAWGVVYSVFTGFFKPVSFSIVGMCFTVKMAQASSDLRNMTIEKYLTICLQLVLCMFIVAKSDDLLKWIIQIGLNAAQTVQNTIIELLDKDVAGLLENAYPTAEDSNLWKGIKEVFTLVLDYLQLALPYVAYIIVSFAMKIAVYGVVIELMVRSALFPLFCGDIMLYGYEGRGFHSLKGFAATALQCMVIVLIAGIVNGINYTSLSNVVGAHTADIGGLVASIGVVIVTDFAGFSLMMKAGQITREAIGA